MSHQYFRLCCFWRIFKLRKAEPPEDIKQVFQDYSENGTMSIDNLHKFLTEYQREVNATMDYAQDIYDSVKHLNIFHRKGLHLQAFVRYLFGDFNLPLSSSLGVIFILKNCHIIFHDLNDYFIFSTLFLFHYNYITLFML